MGGSKREIVTVVRAEQQEQNVEEKGPSGTENKEDNEIKLQHIGRNSVRWGQKCKTPMSTHGHMGGQFKNDRIRNQMIQSIKEKAHIATGFIEPPIAPDNPLVSLLPASCLETSPCKPNKKGGI